MGIGGGSVTWHVLREKQLPPKLGVGVFFGDYQKNIGEGWTLERVFLSNSPNNKKIFEKGELLEMALT